MTSILEATPYPWADATACELHTLLCQARPTVNFALTFARMSGLDPTLIRSDQAPYFVWLDVLEQAAAAGRTYSLVKLVHDSLSSQSPARQYLEALLNGKAGVIQPSGGAETRPGLADAGTGSRAFQSRRPNRPPSSLREAILFDSPVVADAPPEPVAQFLPEFLPAAEGAVHALVAHYQPDVESALHDSELVLSRSAASLASSRELVWVRGEDVWQSPPPAPGDPEYLLVARLVCPEKCDPAEFRKYLDNHPADFLFDFSRFGVREVRDLANPAKNKQFAAKVGAVQAFAQTVASRGCRVVLGLPRMLFVAPEWRDAIGGMACRFAAPLFSPRSPSPDTELTRTLHSPLRELVGRLLRSNSVALRNYLRQEASRLTGRANWTDDAANKEVLALATKLANDGFVEPAYRLELWHRTRPKATTSVLIAADLFPPENERLLGGTLDDIRDLPRVARPGSVPLRVIVTGESGQGKTAALRQIEHRWALPNAIVSGGTAAWLPLYLNELSNPAAGVREVFEAPQRNNTKLKAHELVAQIVTADNVGWVFGSPLLLLFDQLRDTADGEPVGEWVTALIGGDPMLGLVTACRSLSYAPTESKWFSEAWGNPPFEARIRPLDLGDVLSIFPGDRGQRIARMLSQIDRPLSDLAGNRFLVACLAEIGADEVPQCFGLFDLLDRYVRERLKGVAMIEVLGGLTDLAGDVSVEGQAAQERRQRVVREGINRRIIDRESQRFLHPLLKAYFVTRYLVASRQWEKRWPPAADAVTDPKEICDYLFRMLIVCLPVADRDAFIRRIREYRGDVFAHSCLLELAPDEYRQVPAAAEIRNALVGQIDALRPTSYHGDGLPATAVIGRSSAEALGYYDPRLLTQGNPLDRFVPLGPADNPDCVRINRFPVTNLEYAAFVADGGYSDTRANNDHWSKEGREWRNRQGVTAPRFWSCRQYNRANVPVIGVSFHEAVAYARWLTARLTKQETGQWEVALPTRAEWWAAVRPTHAPVPAGGTLDAPLIRTYDEVRLILNRYADQLYSPGNLPVGLFQPSPAGAYDLIGNIWQLCDDWFSANANQELPSAFPSPSGPVIVCGGPVSGPARAVAALMGSGIDQFARVFNIGFRLVARRIG